MLSRTCNSSSRSIQSRALTSTVLSISRKQRARFENKILELNSSRGGWFNIPDHGSYQDDDMTETATTAAESGVIADYNQWLHAVHENSGCMAHILPHSLLRCERLLQHGAILHVQWLGSDTAVDADAYAYADAHTDVRAHKEYTLGYTRLQHSVAVSVMAKQWCHLHCTDPLVFIALQIAALFHDVGHLALSHFGERIVRETVPTWPLVSHETRSVAACSQFILSDAVHTWRDKGIHHYVADSTKLLGTQTCRQDALESLSQMTACLIDPSQASANGIAASTWSRLERSNACHVLSATNTSSMDIDRCTYLLWDAPPTLHKSVDAAVQAWLKSACPIATAKLCHLRRLLHTHVYGPSNAVSLKKWKGVLESRTTLLHHELRALCAEACLTREPRLADDAFTCFAGLWDLDDSRGKSITLPLVSKDPFRTF